MCLWILFLFCILLSRSLLSSPFSIHLSFFPHFLLHSQKQGSVSQRGQPYHVSENSLFRSWKQSIFLQIFYCLDCFVRVMKTDPEAPYLGAAWRGLSRFCFSFQAGSLQMRAEGHSEVREIVLGHQSRPVQRSHSR